MSAPLELWSRPWAMVEIKRRYRQLIEGSQLTIGDDHRAGLWLFTPTAKAIAVNGSTETGEPVLGFDHSTLPRTLLHLPLPLRRHPPTSIKFEGKDVLIQWPSVPERPPTKHTPQNDEEARAHDLFLRARSVWDRLRDVDSALGDPAVLWQELRRRWTSDDYAEPQMDVIVRHAINLRRTIDELDRAPRHILRRTHRQVPLSRVQELDRRSMTWLVRQPGTSLAERAGVRQAILAVARDENFDTLENRVLRAYAELAAFVASDYLARNNAKRKSRRAELVDAYRRRCKRLGRELAEKGVRLAAPGVMPNFVLQQNSRYNKVWDAWGELVKRERENDDLWRWQGRSWEEFCALAVMVALVGIPGAQLIVSSPLTFRDEQKRGRWIDHDNPLGAFYLQEQGLVVEVHFAAPRPGTMRSDFAAPIWISVGKVGAIDGFLSNVPVWPIWDHKGSLVAGETSELHSVIQLGNKARISAGLVLRPTAAQEAAQMDQSGTAVAISVGTQGAPLYGAIHLMSTFFSSLIIGGAKQ